MSDKTKVHGIHTDAVIEKQIVPTPALTVAAKYELPDEARVEGTQDLDRSDLQIPLMILTQATSKKVPEPNKHGGEFYNNLTGEFRTEITAVILSLAKGRVCFDRVFSNDADPLCGSDDALAPRAEFFGAMITDSKTNTDAVIGDAPCSECPLSKFTENANGDAVPPMCTKSYTYAMLDTETGMPFLISAQRSSTQAGKQLNTIAKTMGRARYIKIASQYVSNDSGNYYVLSFATNGNTEKDTQLWAQKYSLESGNIAKRVSALTSGVTTKQIAAPKSEEELPF